MSKTRTHGAWRSARYRCRNPRAPFFEHYGGRGITFSPEWDDFNVFLDEMGECPPGLSLERLDNNKGYEPGNCTWADARTQTNNRRCCTKWELDGVTRTATEWARLLGMRPATLLERVRAYGWTVTRALTTPARQWRSSVR